MNLRPRRPEDPEINLINMIDVLLVLLIFFMVSTTFNQEGRVKVQLPQSSDMPMPRGSHDPLVITITAEGAYRVNERTLINSSPGDLARRACSRKPAPSAGPITIRADARTTHQAVVTAMDVAGKLGFAQLNIATVHEDTPLERRAGGCQPRHRRLVDLSPLDQVREAARRRCFSSASWARFCSPCPMPRWPTW